MSKGTILFADNDPDFLQARAEFLQEEGYRVIQAANPTEARRLLEQGRIHLAILDVRLVDEDDEKDTSGLILTREVARSVPKIVLTDFPTYEAVREVLGSATDGLPPAVDFLDKKEGSEKLLTAVRRVFGSRTQEQHQHFAWRPIIAAILTITALVLSILAGVYNDIRWFLGSLPLVVFLWMALDIRGEDAESYQHALRWTKILAVAIGITIILAGAAQALKGSFSIGILNGIQGVIISSLGWLLERRSKEIR